VTARTAAELAIILVLTAALMVFAVVTERPARQNSSGVSPAHSRTAHAPRPMPDQWRWVTTYERFFREPAK
jgi:hypothetical protein